MWTRRKLRTWSKYRFLRIRWHSPISKMYSIDPIINSFSSQWTMILGECRIYACDAQWSTYISTFVYVSYFRVVKEEIIEDDAHLPCFNGRVVSWVGHCYYTTVRWDEGLGHQCHIRAYHCSRVSTFVVRTVLVTKFYMTLILHVQSRFQLVSAEGSNVSDGGASQCTDSVAQRMVDHG